MNVANPQHEIVEAISEELEKSSECIDFTVAKRQRVEQCWQITIDVSGGKAKGLDESLEGAMAWWRGDPKNGAADVLSVLPKRQQINLRFATIEPPGEGGLLRVYIPRYLEALHSIWQNDVVARKSLA